MARELRRKYPSSPPPEGEGGTANPPRFTLLRELIGRSNASLLGRMDTGLDVPGSGSGPALANKKRKVVTSKVANNNNNGRSNSSWGLVRTISDIKIARQACVYSASCRACPRNEYSYEHVQQLEAPPTPPPPPPAPSLPFSRNLCRNSSSRSVTTERLPPLQAPGTEGWRGLANSTQAVERRTVGEGVVEDADRAMESLVDVVRGVRGDGTGPAAERGRPGGIAEWGPLQLSRIHACRWHQTACPNLVRYRRISSSVRAPGQSHYPRYQNPFIPTSPPTHPTCPVACLH